MWISKQVPSIYAHIQEGPFYIRSPFEPTSFTKKITSSAETEIMGRHRHLQTPRQTSPIRHCHSRIFTSDDDLQCTFYSTLYALYFPYNRIKIPKIDNGGRHITYFIHPDSNQVPDVVSLGTTRCNFRSLLLKLSVSTIKHTKHVLKSKQQMCIPRFVFSTTQEHCRLLLQAHVQVTPSMKFSVTTVKLLQ